ncbi:hypothetical protein NT6N_18520 [Oceaniferula spumae]|uniref:Penicillin-binding protein transpeptidase domain-containing protein n=1 Tax=Oceaniferula spumae TaxID=2979115 RepID=A0AAT9FLK0_9BACT
MFSVAAEYDLVSRPEWKAVFAEFKAEGTMVVVDERAESGGRFVYNRKRAATRFSPASTFKIPHAMFAIDAGVVRDEFQVIPWDGKKRFYEPWNRDQTLRSSMRHSVVWVYQTFEKAIGEEGERKYMEKINYGNADPTGKAPFWVEGNLRISAVEQIDFLQRLHRNKLPLSLNAQRLVKDVMINEAGSDWILRAKTGWSGTIGWWVGWVEHPSGVVFFALNMDTPNRMDDLFKREAIARRILHSMNALPKKPGEVGPNKVTKEQAIEAFQEYRAGVKIVTAIHKELIQRGFDAEEDGEIKMKPEQLTKYKVARKHWQKSVGLNPLFPEVYVFLANSYWEIENDLPTTIQYYNKALEIDPDYDDVISARAQVYLLLKQLDAAEKDLLRLEALDSEHAESLREEITKLRAAGKKE